MAEAATAEVATAAAATAVEVMAEVMAEAAAEVTAMAEVAMVVPLSEAREENGAAPEMHANPFEDCMCASVRAVKNPSGGATRRGACLSRRLQHSTSACHWVQRSHASAWLAATSSVMMKRTTPRTDFWNPVSASERRGREGERKSKERWDIQG
jgi:hypothetical protein